MTLRATGRCGTRCGGGSSATRRCGTTCGGGGNSNLTGWGQCGARGGDGICDIGDTCNRDDCDLCGPGVRGAGRIGYSGVGSRSWCARGLSGAPVDWDVGFSSWWNGSRRLACAEGSPKLCIISIIRNQERTDFFVLSACRFPELNELHVGRPGVTSRAMNAFRVGGVRDQRSGPLKVRLAFHHHRNRCC